MNQQRRLTRQPRNKSSDTQASNKEGSTRGNSTRGRSNRGNSSRANRNPNRGNASFQPRFQGHPNVPTYSSIQSGTAVSIVLKIDQPTGHEVKGIVADVLTRGDHPRGVKVRLRDGRVGRVQGLISQDEGESGERIVGGDGAGLGRNGVLGENGEVGGGREMGSSRSGVGRVKGDRIERDVRENDEWFYDEQRRGKEGTEGLFAALEEADRRHETGRWGGVVTGYERRESVSTGVIATCPVCGQFEGDEGAVAHHVEGHFAD